MTTEVLRNMLYADSPLLRDLAYVVMDEVHYLADRFRGAVWEEVIIHLPQAVRLVSLSARRCPTPRSSATGSQAVRGDTEVIVSEERPVPLEQHVLVRGELLDLFDDRAGIAAATGSIRSSCASGSFKGATSSTIAARSRRAAPQGRRIAADGTAHGRHAAGAPRRQRSSASTGPRSCELLERANLLPAIFFIFSRVGCDARRPAGACAPASG